MLKHNNIIRNSEKYRNEVRLYWERIGPDFYVNGAPPAYISGESKAIYEKIFKSKISQGDTTLVLGTTPALRDLLGSFDSANWVADFSDNGFSMTERVLSPAVRAKEDYFIGDWLKLETRFAKESLKLVTGDLIFRQMPLEDGKNLISVIDAILSSDGVFVLRSSSRNLRWRSVSCGEILNLGLKLDRRSDIKKRLAVTLTVFRLRDRWTDESGRVRINKLKAELFDTLNANGNPWLAEFGSGVLNYMTEPPLVSWTHLSEAQFMELISDRFIIEHEFHAMDYPDAEFFPIYVLKKK
ncbi:hypothetical protein A2833_02240 [Candidatus Azambacteria bacterium RIFCSPHIGHO2_01_FULL_44_55]|uniref:Histidine-specific methyltransferase SAM-dependent domain-containing protein n=1 Tax=Candidatus Azambacteria bacterium RIFCSPLOWO2_02_FULL_44_14 TaxID=1797306 RepID=A0A1F5CCP2_9BACT|nr:MAG: hypothetical protein A3A18_01610 [Candidatus Azambacteria bacterium RIFCSPLOWO2_01_FULL_44_84]OGD32975.1 MAG: hypothetical protein A3C78_00395 [Candidatus Azambacteria bacterium RIFCSPHIGHO2_02_FULL_45_18]OGD40419.1 MAG: hypothetical protein A2833_02240 [Candidatus Azambacteria bacterium RIFCSPHIGHO2_01_FULL_44_55]OGD40631.1 MAG: hypothetical protein A3I30_01260 [Candidatus Azambacteria bacterium RIFCSPLOWO2_02_FULL_44_14]OGD52320.1 MAG: hypothetical protein A2608_00210 [Candidatus Azam